MALDKLKEKALHTLFSLRKHTHISNLSPFLANKLFDAMISPFLTYNSEIWGVYTKPDFKSTAAKCTAHAPYFYFLSTLNLVPRGCIPFGQHQGCKTSGILWDNNLRSGLLFFRGGGRAKKKGKPDTITC